jgi:hypothetical protein
MLYMANLGLPVDPRPLLPLIQPALKGKKMLTRGELHAVWGRRQYLRSWLILHGEGGAPSCEKGVAVNGVQLTLTVRQDGAELEARGPLGQHQ